MQSNSDLLPIVVVHGGAGDIENDVINKKKHAIKAAACVGYATYIKTGSVIDAVQEAIRYMELDEIFNAGYGAVLTSDGKTECDASIMNGKDLSAGCVSMVTDIYHPIKLARYVMEKSPHTYLSGQGAMNFAENMGMEILPEGWLTTPRSMKALEAYQCKLDSSSCDCVSGAFGSQGTVGCVAIDYYGNVAAGTSTGGLTGKMPGRIGDSPILGAGTYADNDAGAVSCTGHGETFMRYNVASRILSLIRYDGLEAQDAAQEVIQNMTNRFCQTGGAITVDKYGGVGISFTTDRMAWAYQCGKELHYGIDNEECVDIVSTKYTRF